MFGDPYTPPPSKHSGRQGRAIGGIEILHASDIISWMNIHSMENTHDAIGSDGLPQSGSGDSQ